MRSRSSLVGPLRTPWSRAPGRTQPRSVSALHPIFAAIGLIAAHAEACSPRCSCTSRTARKLLTVLNALLASQTDYQRETPT
jgi:hypothetical protein